MTQSEAPSARDLLGMPVPPSWAARAATVTRSGVGHAHARMSPPFQLVLERMLGVVDSACLAAAVELGIADLLGEDAATAEELARRLGADTDADALERLLDFLVTRDVFTVDRAGRFANNAVSSALRCDAIPRWRDWALFLGSDWAGDILGSMAARIRTGRPASELAFGRPFFDVVNGDGAASSAFNGAMEAGSTIQAALFAEAIDLTGVSSLCDVGGGTGAVAAHVARLHPHLRATVLDLPALADRAANIVDAPDLGGRVRFVGGDFFAAVPAGHDCYTLFAVVHDWADEAVAAILARIREAMNDSARVMVVDQVLPARGRAGFARATDMLMLAFGDGGRERNREEFVAVFADAGFEVAESTTLPSLFEVFELRPTDRPRRGAP